MARALRIEYPDAWYHVMNHDRRAEKIFAHKIDYHASLDLLQEPAELWKLKIAGFSLMPTCYHPLVQTPHATLSRFMRHINGVYTQRFNSVGQSERGGVSFLTIVRWTKSFQARHNEGLCRRHR